MSEKVEFEYQSLVSKLAADCSDSTLIKDHLCEFFESKGKLQSISRMPRTVDAPNDYFLVTFENSEDALKIAAALKLPSFGYTSLILFASLNRLVPGALQV